MAPPELIREWEPSDGPWAVAAGRSGIFSRLSRWQRLAVRVQSRSLRGSSLVHGTMRRIEAHPGTLSKRLLHTFHSLLRTLRISFAPKQLLSGIAAVYRESQAFHSLIQ
jgi:hypothetical protein